MEACRIPIDILIDEIFLKLPVKSVFRFKCVSKTCNKRLSERSFHQKYQNSRHPPPSSLLPVLGLFHGSQVSGVGIVSEAFPAKLCFVPFCKESTHIRSRNFIKWLGVFLAASNGLILCGFPPSILYVCNPVTDQWLRQLPPPPNNRLSSAGQVMLGFLYEEHDTSCPSYTIVRAGCQSTYSNLLAIETYSSKTRFWTESLLKAPIQFRLVYQPCTVVDGVFYWVGCRVGVFYWMLQYVLVAHDPKAEHGCVWIIDINSYNNLSHVHLGKSSDGRLLYGICQYFYNFKIARLQNPLHDYSPCTLIQASECITILVLTLSPPAELRFLSDKYVVAFHPQDGRFLLMKHGTTFYWLDLENRAVTQIWSLPVAVAQTNRYPPFNVVNTNMRSFTEFPGWAMIPYFQPEWPPSPLI